MKHLQLEDVFRTDIHSNDVVLVEAPSFHNLVEVMDHIIQRDAIPCISVTHSTYSKVKTDRKSLTTDAGMRIISRFNTGFIKEFILHPYELKINDAYIIEGQCPDQDNIIRALHNNGIDVHTITYDELEEEIRECVVVDDFIFRTRRVKSNVERGMEWIVSKCVKRIRSEGLGDEYMERMKHELHVMARTDLIGMLIDIYDLMKDVKYSLRGSANNSLVCYLLGMSYIDPVKYDLPFERFINRHRIYKWV